MRRRGARQFALLMLGEPAHKWEATTTRFGGASATEGSLARRKLRHYPAAPAAWRPRGRGLSTAACSWRPPRSWRSRG